MMRSGMKWLGTGLVLAASLLAGCGGGSSTSTSTASVRLLNATSGYDALDLAIDGSTVNTGLGYGQVGSYAAAGTSGVSASVNVTGATSALSTSIRTFAADTAYTLLVYGSTGALKTALLTESATAAAANFTSLQIMNLAPDAGTVDVYLTGSADALDSANPVASGVAAGSTVTYGTLASGTYRLRVTGTGDKTDLRLGC